MVLRGVSLIYQHLFQFKRNEIAKHIHFVRIVIKTGLVIRTDNAKILTSINNIIGELQHERYYVNKRSAERVRSFADNITEKRKVKLPRLIMHRECTII